MGGSIGRAAARRHEVDDAVAAGLERLEEGRQHVRRLPARVVQQHDAAADLVDAAEEAFAKAGAKEKLVVRVNAGVAHKVTDEDRKEAIAFCVKWLKAEAKP